MRKILVIDDETNARTALAELLRDEGFTVDTAADCAEALGKLPSFSPHVVITELEMPGTTGAALLASLLDRIDAPSVIAVTGFGQLTAAVAALRAGARGYITKPIDLDELLAVLGQVIEHHDLEREVVRLRNRAQLAHVL